MPAVLLFKQLICIAPSLLLLGKINTLACSGGYRLPFPHCQLLPFSIFSPPSSSLGCCGIPRNPESWVHLPIHQLCLQFLFYSIISNVTISSFFCFPLSCLLLVIKLYWYNSFHFIFPLHSPCPPTSFYTLVHPWCLVFQLSEWSVFSAASLLFKAAISVTIRLVNKDNVSHPGSLTAALQLTQLIGGHSLNEDGGKLVKQSVGIVRLPLCFWLLSTEMHFVE